MRSMTSMFFLFIKLTHINPFIQYIKVFCYTNELAFNTEAKPFLTLSIILIKNKLINNGHTSFKEDYFLSLRFL